MRSRSRGAVRPRYGSNSVPPGKRGRREDRVRAAPTVSCAKCTRKTAHEHTGSAETLRASLRSGLRLIGALLGEPCTLATVARGSRTANVTPAWGCQDHTISPSAPAPFVKGASASTASHRAFRDDREPPLLSGETGKFVRVICPSGKAKFYPTD